MEFENTLLRIHQEYAEQQLSQAEYCAALLLTRELRLQNKPLFKNLKASSAIIQKLNSHHWIGYSDRIRRALIQWHLENYPLDLFFTIPTPLEILEKQAQGRRVVTVFSTVEAWKKTYGPHDAWNFIVHDLIHADHFFENPENRLGQIQFYKSILRHWNSAEISGLHQEAGFEYLISDMNSHPQHMLETLQSLLIQSFKKQNEMGVSEKLPDPLENQLQIFMNQIKNAMETF